MSDTLRDRIAAVIADRMAALSIQQAIDMPTFDYMTVAVGEYANPEFSFGDRIRKIRREVAHMTHWEA